MKISRKLIIGIFLVVATLSFSLTTIGESTANDKIGASLRKLLHSGDTEFPVLIILKSRANFSQTNLLQSKGKETKGRIVYDLLRKTALDTQGPLIEWLKSKGYEAQRFYVLNALAVEGVTAEMLMKIAAREDVARVIGNPVVRQNIPHSQDLLDEPSPLTIEPGITSTGAQKVWDEFNVTGTRIVVAGQDTGVQWDHPALKSKYRGLSRGGSVDHNYNWHDAIHTPIVSSTNKCGYSSATPCDDNAHGTHTMGTMVGDDGAANKIGMAPGAQWIACHNMDQGYGRPSTYIECFEFFLAPYAYGKTALRDGDPTKAPHVINNSWGCPLSEGCQGGEMLDILKALYEAGIMVVASAGNEGPGCSTIASPPAHHTDLTFAVGAHSATSGTIAGFSSRGPSKFNGGIGPDITAPGVEVRSAVPGSGYEGGWSGTSMAGPHVVGAVALLWSAQPKLIGNIAETISILRKTATPTTHTQACGGVLGSSIPNNVFGYGKLNVYKAVSAATYNVNK